MFKQPLSTSYSAFGVAGFRMFCNVFAAFFSVMNNVSMQCLRAYLLQVVRSQTLKITPPARGRLRLHTQWKKIFFPSLLLMIKSNKLLSLEMWFSIQRADALDYRVDSSLIRKFPHECSCTSKTLSPGVIIIAPLHEKESLEIQLAAPYRYLKCKRYIPNCTATSVQCA